MKKTVDVNEGLLLCYKLLTVVKNRKEIRNEATDWKQDQTKNKTSEFFFVSEFH